MGTPSNTRVPAAPNKGAHVAAPSLHVDATLRYERVYYVRIPPERQLELLADKAGV